MRTRHFSVIAIIALLIVALLAVSAQAVSKADGVQSETKATAAGSGKPTEQNIPREQAIATLQEVRNKLSSRTDVKAAQNTQAAVAVQAVLDKLTAMENPQVGEEAAKGVAEATGAALAKADEKKKVAQLSYDSEADQLTIKAASANPVAAFFTRTTVTRIDVAKITAQATLTVEKENLREQEVEATVQLIEAVAKVEEAKAAGMQTAAIAALETELARSEANARLALPATKVDDVKKEAASVAKRASLNQEIKALSAAKDAQKISAAPDRAQVDAALSTRINIMEAELEKLAPKEPSSVLSSTTQALVESVAVLAVVGQKSSLLQKELQTAPAGIEKTILELKDDAFSEQQEEAQDEAGSVQNDAVKSLTEQSLPPLEPVATEKTCLFGICSRATPVTV